MYSLLIATFFMPSLVTAMEYESEEEDIFKAEEEQKETKAKKWWEGGVKEPPKKEKKGKRVTKKDVGIEAEEYSPDIYSYFSVPEVPPTIDRNRFADFVVDPSLNTPGEKNFRNEFGWGKSNFLLKKLPKDKTAYATWKKKWIFEAPVTIEDTISYPRAAIFQGTYEFKSVRDLNTMVQKKGPVSSQAKFTIKVFDPNDPNATEVIHMQGDSAYKNAAFQLASTFFGPLEGGIVKGTSYLANMYPHAVQGEDASVGAIGAAYWRKYIMPTMRINSGERKLGEWPYDYLLHYLKDKAPMEIQNKGFPRIPFSAIKKYQYNPKDKERVGVGIHRDIVAVYKGGQKNVTDPTYGTLKPAPIIVDNEGNVNTAKTQTITQIFTSAYNISTAKKLDEFNSNMEQFCKVVLEGMYEGTIKAAIAHNIKTVVLTLVGGSAFGNDIAWIGKVIENQKDIIKNYGLNVILIYYPPDKRRIEAKLRTKAGDLAFLKSMAKLSDEINNTHVAAKLSARLEDYLDAAFQFNSNPVKGDTEEQVYMAMANELKKP